MQGLTFNCWRNSATRLVTTTPCRGLAPAMANISPWKYSLLNSALRSSSRYSAGVSNVVGCEDIYLYDSILLRRCKAGFLRVSCRRPSPAACSFPPHRERGYLASNASHSPNRWRRTSGPEAFAPSRAQPRRRFVHGRDGRERLRPSEDDLAANLVARRIVRSCARCHLQASRAPPRAGGLTPIGCRFSPCCFRPAV